MNEAEPIDAGPTDWTLPQLLDRAADRWPDRPVVTFFQTPGARLTFAELKSRADDLAAGLAAYGVGPGTPVGVVLPNVPAFPIAWLAIARLGGIMVPINHRYTVDEFRFVFDDVSIAHVLADESFAPTMESAGLRAADHLFVCDATGTSFGPYGAAAPSPVGEQTWPTVHPDDPVGIHYTSGTTGFPKGCVLTHRSWVINAVVLAQVLPRTPRRILSDAPYFYLDAPLELAFALYVGAEQYVAEKVSLSQFVRWLVDLDIDYAEVWEALGDRVIDPDSEARLRERETPMMMTTFGLPGEHQAGLEKRLNATIREMFGMTEVGLAMLVPFDEDGLVGSGSVGVVAPYRETRIVDPETLLDAPTGTVGELWVRGPGLLLEYYCRPEVNQDVFQPGGWFRTGDLARIDEHGHHYIAGRLKDMIRRSHENIAATEVEAALASHPAVADKAVIGVPDELRGEEVKAFLVLEPGVPASDETAASVLDHAAEHLAAFKVPRYVEFVDDLPLTPSGKIAKRVLRDRDPAAQYDRTTQYDRTGGGS